jgi:hypothetical protein
MVAAIKHHTGVVASAGNSEQPLRTCFKRPHLCKDAREDQRAKREHHGLISERSRLTQHDVELDDWPAPKAKYRN